MEGKRIGDFELREQIGKGGMGRVYRARQISLDRDVAVKVLPRELCDVEEFRERFDVEAKAVASLLHQNIIQIYSKGVTEDGVDFFAMEYVEGEDLSAKLKRGAKFTEREALDIAIQACQGLEAAWRKNIIHRDVKPSNLMVTSTGTVKVADFGLAKNFAATKKLTRTNVYMGTVNYTSPEQGEGRPVDHRTDIYSLGIVLYQLLTGRVPFDGDTPSVIIYKHVFEPPPPPRSFNPGLSPESEAVVLKAIAKNPEDRYQDAVEFREALESIKTGSKGLAAGPALVKKGKGKRPAVRAAVVILILLIAGAGYASYSYVYPRIKSLSSNKDTAVPPAAPVAVATPSPDEATPGSVVDTPASASKEAVREASSEARPARVAVPDSGVAVNDPKTSTRPATPTVQVVASGDRDASDIAEAVIEKKLYAGSFKMSGKGDVIVYVTVVTSRAEPLRYYGRTTEQSSSTITVKVMDAATSRTVVPPVMKTVNYTSLNMRDNLQEATEEMVSDLPRKIEEFWKG